MFWTDREGRTRRLKLSTEKAGEVRWTHRFVKGGLAGGRAAFEAFNLAPPGANVLVAERGLTDEEARYRKLFRRYLPFGPASIALYVSAEEDVRLVSEYVERMTLTPEDLKGIARGAIGQSMWELAGNVLEKALAQLPEDEDVVYELAGCLMRSGRPQEGLDRLEGFLSRGQGSGRTHTMRGLLLMELQRPEEAFHSVGKAVELDPNETDALNLWFDLVANEAGIPQAVAEIDVVASQRPEAWGPNLVLGQRLLPMGRTDEGIERLRRADAIGRNDETVQALGSSLLGSERVDEAIDVLEKAGELRELGPGAILVLAQAYAARGDAGAALETVELFNPEKDPKWKPAFDALRSRIAT